MFSNLCNPSIVSKRANSHREEIFSRELVVLTCEQQSHRTHYRSDKVRKKRSNLD